MKLALVAPSPVPFAIGGAENLWSGLLAAFNALPGIEADLIKLPSPERNFGEILASYRVFLDLDLNHFDQIISTKYPAWMVSHPNHVVYLQHTLRGLYDTYPSQLPKALPARLPPALRRLLQSEKPLSSAGIRELLDCAQEAQLAAALPPEDFALPGPLLRAIVHALDRYAMAPERISRHFAISHTIAGRADYFPPTLIPEVIHHPTSLATQTHPNQDYIFTASRLDKPKRIDLLIEAYRRSGVTLPFLIAGSGPEELRLKTLAQGTNVRFLGRLTDSELAYHYANACFVPFAPLQEDYGLVTLEAMLSGKPVLTTHDAGGVTELVRHGETGLIVTPTPEALADGMAQLAADLAGTAGMGAQGRLSVTSIKWEVIANRLIVPPTPQENGPFPLRGSECRRPRILVVNTFSVAPPTTGGQQRIYHLYRHLAKYADIDLIVPVGPYGQAENATLAPGFIEHRLPVSLALSRVIQELDQDTGASCGDLAFTLFPLLNGQLTQAIAEVARRADARVASHPYMYPLLPASNNKPLIYDAHNVEWDLKRTMYGHTPWIDAVREVEGVCGRSAQRIMTCSEDDAERMAAIYDIPRKRITVISNGTNLNGVPAIDESILGKGRLDASSRADRPPVAIFIGANHQPNQVAGRILSQIANTVPEWDFVIAGSVCDALGDLPRTSNLQLLGVLTEAQKAVWLKVADLGLNPMTTGSGSNLKLLDYLAHGLPVLSTPFGVRGYTDSTLPVIITEIDGFPEMLHRLFGQREQFSFTRGHPGATANLQALDWQELAKLAWHTCFLPCLQ